MLREKSRENQREAVTLPVTKVHELPAGQGFWPCGS